jgi:hypothetical protein
VAHSIAAQLAERVPLNTSTASLAKALAAAHSALQQPQGIVVFVVQVSTQQVSQAHRSICFVFIASRSLAQCYNTKRHNSIQCSIAVVQ